MLPDYDPTKQGLKRAVPHTQSVPEQASRLRSNKTRIETDNLKLGIEAEAGFQTTIQQNKD